MNRIGAFAKIFKRPTLEDTLDAALACGFDCVQFNLSCAGLPTVPAHVDAAVRNRIAGAIRSRGITVAAISGTCNLIDRDPARRLLNFAGLGVLSEVCRETGTSVVTICSGTRDGEDMWRAHPENQSAESWQEMIHAMECALETTEPSGVTLAVEPEPGNVLRGTLDARRLLDELCSPRLKIVMDGANLVSADPERPQEKVLGEAFDLLGGDIVLLHAKPLARACFDWGIYLELALRSGYRGPVILHGMTEDGVVAAFRDTREILQTYFLRSNP